MELDYVFHNGLFIDLCIVYIGYNFVFAVSLKYKNKEDLFWNSVVDRVDDICTLLLLACFYCWNDNSSC